MFWHYVFSNNSAQIEKLLQKEDVTLAELMEEEELLQECQAQNKKLIDFLCQDHVLSELVSLVVTEPSSDFAYQTRFKHASLAAELLSAEVPAIVDKISSSDSLLATLCNFLNNEKPLNPLLASFFSKVLSSLLHRRTEQNWYQYQVTSFRVLDFLKSNTTFIPRAVYHIGTSAVMTLLQKLMCGIEEEQVSSRIHTWLLETPLIPLLINKLSPENDWSEQSCVELLFNEVFNKAACTESLGGASPAAVAGGNGSSVALNTSSDNGTHSPFISSLLPYIMSEESVRQIIGVLLHENGTPSSVTHVSNVLVRMLSMHSCLLCMAVRSEHDCSYLSAAAAQLQEQQQLSLASEDSNETTALPSQFCVARTVAEAIPQIHQMILKPSEDYVQTSYGTSVERVGATRLRLIALITALIESRHFRIHEQLAQHKTIPYIIELFFKFGQNNFLHCLVQRCVLSLLSQHSPCHTPPDAVLRRLASDVAARARTSSTATETVPSSSPPPAADEQLVDDRPPPAHPAEGRTELMDSEPSQDEQCDRMTQDLSSDIPCCPEESCHEHSSSAASDALADEISLAPPVAVLEEVSGESGDASSSTTAAFSSETTEGSSSAVEMVPSLLSNDITVTGEVAEGESRQSSSSSSSTPDEESHPLLCQILRHGCLVQRILLAFNVPLSDEHTAGLLGPPIGNLCGYKGHLRLIANALVQHSTEGPNAPLLNLLLQSLPSEVYRAWQDFHSTTLVQINTLNEVSPVPNDNMLQLTDDDLHLSFPDNNGFDGVDSTGLPGSLVAKVSSPVKESSPDTADMFEKICAARNDSSAQDFESIWNSRERQITFATGIRDIHCEEDSTNHSSDEDEDDAEQQPLALCSDEPPLRKSLTDNHMDIDDLQDEWESVFDRRGSGDDEEDSSTAQIVVSPVRSSPTSHSDFSSWQSSAVPVPSLNKAVVSHALGNEEDDDTWANFGSPVFSLSHLKAAVAPTVFDPNNSFGGAADESASSFSFEAKFPSKLHSPGSSPSGHSVPFAAEPFSFEAKFPINLSPIVAPASAGASVSSPSEVENSTDTETFLFDSDNKTDLDDDLHTNFHFLSRLGALQSSNAQTDSALASNATQHNSALTQEDSATTEEGSSNHQCIESSKATVEVIVTMHQEDGAEPMEVDAVEENNAAVPPLESKDATEDALSQSSVTEVASVSEEGGSNCA